MFQKNGNTKRVRILTSIPIWLLVSIFLQRNCMKSSNLRFFWIHKILFLSPIYISTGQLIDRLLSLHFPLPTTSNKQIKHKKLLNDEQHIKKSKNNQQKNVFLRINFHVFLGMKNIYLNLKWIASHKVFFILGFQGGVKQ